MARIRTIKPEFPQSESVGKVSRDARLLFVQLWTICDDAGRTRAAPRLLASLLYPYDDDAPALIPTWLKELEAAECVRLYEVDGSHYLDIPKWLDHQRIDRPSASKFPEYQEGSSKPREPSADPRSGKEWKGPEGTGTGTRERAPARAQLLPEGWEPTEADLAELRKGRPEIVGDLYAKRMQDFRDWTKANAKTSHDWTATWRGFMRQTKLPPVSKFTKPEDIAGQTVNRDDDSQWRARISGWRPGKMWLRGDWGPEPGEPGCRVPPSIYEEWASKKQERREAA